MQSFERGKDAKLRLEVGFLAGAGTHRRSDRHFNCCCSALLWWTGDKNFAIKWSLIVEDVTPWALTFYAITLIGATMNDFWSKLPSHPVLGVALILTAFAVAIYGAFIVIWRHNSAFTPGTGVYVVTFLLLGISIGLCYRGAHT